MPAPPSSHDPEATQTYLAHLATIGVDPESLVAGERGTIASDEEVMLTVERLPELRIAEEGASRGTAVDLRFEHRLGAGGMGVVVAAEQVPLRRRVAVKRLRGGAKGSSVGHTQLLREALAIGTLEHPNVAPVHMLGRGPDGEPLLVMKLIEGKRWTEMLEPLYPSRGGADAVDGALRILVQVCNAVHFAHAKGILHRDLKPDNVMIGQFGEVYVLDWGVAVSIGRDAASLLRPATTVSDIEGTPAYMAPEMAAAAGDLIDARTDVYLLGATLHHLITGEGPHEAATLLESLSAAFSSEPQRYDASVPEELASICRRAMAADPADRFADAAAFREAVLAFLRHRDAIQVGAEAERRVAALEAMLAGAKPKSEEVHALASEARFGFEQALRAWPESPEARRGLDRLVAALAGYEEGRERELAALKQAVHETDVGEFALFGRRMAFALGAALVVPILILSALRVFFGRRAGYPDAFGVMLSYALILGLVYWRMLRFERNRMTRQMQGALVWVVLVGTAVLGLGLWLGIDLTAGIAMAMLSSGAVAGPLALLVEKKLWWCALCCSVAAAGIVLTPTYRGLWLAAGYGISFVFARRAWVTR
jgi:protein kinase-like protein